MLAKKYRLHSEKDIQNVFKKGAFFFSPFFNLKILKNNLTNPRFCIVVSTNISKKAVLRNKLKRQVSAFLQKNLSKISQNYDIIIMAQPAALVLNYHELADSLIFLLNKAKI
jgi:ribonuclease P protein component